MAMAAAPARKEKKGEGKKKAAKRIFHRCSLSS
jgi:hypothetical protein